MEDRLRKFAQLVDAGSFTKAAELLHISQPALSTAIGKLERELHTTLLIRGNRSLKLTPSGEVAYAHAKETAVRTGNLKLRIATTMTRALAVRVGIIDSLADTLLTQGPGLSELEKHASVSLVIDNSRLLTNAVARDDVDLAFVVTRPYPPGIITAQPIGAEPLVLVCHYGQGDEIQQALARGSLHHFISYDQSSTTIQLVQQTFRSHHISVHPTLYSTSPEVIRKLVLAQKGAAVLPYFMVRDLLYTRELTLVPIGKSTVISRPIQAIKHRDKLLPVPLEKMADDLKNILSKLHKEALADKHWS